MELQRYFKITLLSSLLIFSFPLLSDQKKDFSVDQSQPTIEILFAPDDKPTVRLVDEIKKAKLRIYVAIYMLTDKVIAKALTEAKRNGIDVQIITDKATADSPFGKINFLKNHDIKTYVFNGEKTTKQTEFQNPANDPEFLTEAQLQIPFKKHKQHQHHSNHKKSDTPPFFKFTSGGLMHEKFGIFDDLIWIGSFNWTVSANRINQENILIFKNKSVLEKLLKRFELLKKRCSQEYYCHEKQTIKKFLDYGTGAVTIGCGATTSSNGAATSCT